MSGPSLRDLLKLDTTKLKGSEGVFTLSTENHGGIPLLYGPGDDGPDITMELVLAFMQSCRADEFAAYNNPCMKISYTLEPRGHNLSRWLNRYAVGRSLVDYASSLPFVSVLTQAQADNIPKDTGFQRRSFSGFVDGWDKLEERYSGGIDILPNKLALGENWGMSPRGVLVYDILIVFGDMCHDLPKYEIALSERTVPGHLTPFFASVEADDKGSLMIYDSQNKLIVNKEVLKPILIP